MGKPNRRGLALSAGLVFVALTACDTVGTVDGPPGAVLRTEVGRPPVGATIVARDSARGMAVAVGVTPEGRFVLPEPGPGSWALFATAFGHAPTPLHPAPSGPVVLAGDGTDASSLPSSSFLAGLPDGEEKRRFIVDCTGCHTLSHAIATVEGRPRSRAEWEEAIEGMLSTSGPGTGFPIISSHPEPASLGRWLSDALADHVPSPPGGDVPFATDAVLTEYDVPEPLDLPHDVAVGPDGDIVVTGMFTDRLYVLDPEAGSWTTTPIPVEYANPRAVEVGADGRWWVLLGAPRRIGAYDPIAGIWELHEIGMYPHSIMADPDGRIWFNGHFSHRPEWIASLDPRTETVDRFEVPDEGDEESTIPYGLRVDRTGVVWSTQLRGNRLIRFDPANDSMRTWTLPVPHSGPRRLDVGPDGTIWIPEYGGNALTRFDPGTETFTRTPFPMDDALPYVVRVDQTRGTVWVGTGAGDVIAAFDPPSRTFAVYALPTTGALVRHLDVNDETGEVWAAYGASPGIPGKVLRVRRP